MWYTSPEKCNGCKNYIDSDCLFDLERVEQEDEAVPGAYTKVKACAFYGTKEEESMFG